MFRGARYPTAPAHFFLRVAGAAVAAFVLAFVAFAVCARADEVTPPVALALAIPSLGVEGGL